MVDGLPWCTWPMLAAITATLAPLLRAFKFVIINAELFIAFELSPQRYDYQWVGVLSGMMIS